MIPWWVALVIGIFALFAGVLIGFHHGFEWGVDKYNDFLLREELDKELKP